MVSHASIQREVQAMSIGKGDDGLQQLSTKRNKNVYNAFLCFLSSFTACFFNSVYNEMQILMWNWTHLHEALCNVSLLVECSSLTLTYVRGSLIGVNVDFLFYNRAPLIMRIIGHSKF